MNVIHFHARINDRYKEAKKNWHDIAGYEEVMEKHVLWTMNGNYDRLAGM